MSGNMGKFTQRYPAIWLAGFFPPVWLLSVAVGILVIVVVMAVYLAIAARVGMARVWRGLTRQEEPVPRPIYIGTPPKRYIGYILRDNAEAVGGFLIRTTYHYTMWPWYRYRDEHHQI